MNDPFAEFYKADGSRVVMTDAEVTAMLARPAQEQLPAHWDMFDSSEIKRITP